jgi:RNA polymerase subunit RPABC4/transcription elongation factor Spt4
MRRGLVEKTAALNERLAKEQALAATIEKNPRVAGFFAMVAGISEAERLTLRDELRRMNFWFPAERLAMQMVFLLPLLAVFWFWNSRSIATGRPFQTLVSSHLLVIAAIPVVLKVAELVYDIIPRRMLRQLIELLESLHLVALWHYLVIALAIAAALTLIYLFQKKLFSHEQLMQRRIAKGQCQACGLTLPLGSRHCPACGALQLRACGHCGAPTPAHGRFCMACGSDESRAMSD